MMPREYLCSVLAIAMLAQIGCRQSPEQPATAEPSESAIRQTSEVVRAETDDSGGSATEPQASRPPQRKVGPPPLAPVQPTSSPPRVNQREFSRGTDLDALLRRAITDRWNIEKTEVSNSDAGPPLTKAMRDRIDAALALAKKQFTPRQVEVPVDTDGDGIVESWVYLANDTPVAVEFDRFQTGVHDFRAVVRSDGAPISEYALWARTPVVPLTTSAIRHLTADDLFDWCIKSPSADSGPDATTRGRLVAAQMPGLLAQLPGLISKSNEIATQDQVLNYVNQAKRLAPGYIRTFDSDSALQARLRDPNSRGWTIESLMLAEDQRHAAGYSPEGLARIRFYRDSWSKDAEKWEADCHLEDGRITRLDWGGRRYLSLGGYWVRLRPDARENIARTYLAPGTQDYRGGKFYSAMERFRRGLLFAGVIDDFQLDPEGRPQERGGSNEEQWRFDLDGTSADSYLDLASGLAWGSDYHFINAIAGFAMQAEQRGNFAEALALYWLTVRISEKFERAERTCYFLDALSDIYRRLGVYDRALECLFKSLDLESTVHYALDVSKKVDLNTTRRGDRTAAYYAQELQTYSMASRRGHKLATIAVLQAGLGEREKAHTYLSEAERILNGLGNGYVQADLLNLRAQWDLEDGQWQLAIDRARRALELSKQEQARQKEYESLSDKERFTRREAEPNRIARHWRIIQDPRSSYDAPIRAIVTSSTTISNYDAINLAITAEAFLQRAQAKNATSGSGAALEDARQMVQRGLEMYQAGGDRAGQCVLQIRLADIALEQKDYAAALRFAKEAQSSAESLGLFEPTWRAYAIQGAACRGLQRFGEAVEHYEQAATAIESIRAKLNSEPVRRGFFGSKLKIYEELASLYLDADQVEMAWQSMERGKSRTLLDLVAGQELSFKGQEVRQLNKTQPVLVQSLRQGLGFGGVSLTLAEQAEEEYRRGAFDATADEVLSLTTIRPSEVASVQKALAADDLLIEYFVTDDSLLIAAISTNGLTTLRVANYGREAVHQDVSRLRQAIERPGRDYAGICRALFDRLLAPVLAKHNDIKQLRIIPGGALHYVPFEALLQPDDRFVLEAYDVSYAASASALVYSMHRIPTAGELGGKALIVADPRPRATVAPLAGAALEGQRINAAVRNPSTLLTGVAATESKLIHELQSAQYFHFAGHAELSNVSPMRAALLCSEDVDNDGRLEVREIFGLELRGCQLAVLSACETRLGKWSRGDEIVGLERAFLRAGIPTVVASLWKVDDAATSVLMEEFYHGLWDLTLPRGVALRRAKLALLRSPQLRQERQQELTGTLAQRGVDFASVSSVTDDTASPGMTLRSHPAYWAAFVLSGNWK